MLVLSRKKQKRTVLLGPAGERIVVVPVDIRGDKVRIGIEAPSDWRIFREELEPGFDGVSRGNLKGQA